MISLICFLLTLAGSINWFCIGVLQYDFIAGLFGSQANVFSRIVYAFIGLSSVWLVFALIKGRGKIKIDGKRATDKSLLTSKKKQMANAESAQMQTPNAFNGISQDPRLNQNYNQPPNASNYQNTAFNSNNPNYQNTNMANVLPQNNTDSNNFDE